MSIKPMDVEQIAPDLLRRLRRIEGQARGVQRMVEEQRGCDEIVTQVAAMKAAVEQVGVVLVGCLLEHAIRNALEHGEDTGEAIAHAKKLLSKL